MPYNPNKRTTSIHLSPATMDTLDSMKHWGQSYDGLINEILLELKNYKQLAKDREIS